MVFRKEYDGNEVSFYSESHHIISGTYGFFVDFYDFLIFFLCFSVLTLFMVLQIFFKN